MTTLKKFIFSNVLYLAWMQALVATLGSLYFSEIRQFAPCVLCWYQRIFMYPLVIIIAVGILRKDKNLVWYVLPLSILGGLVAFYQVLLQYGVVPESTAPCVQGVSCTLKYTNYLGFLSIPMLSLVAFAFISICMLIYKKINETRS